MVLNEGFLRFAAHWGFRVRACRAYRAQTKGKVERPIAYVRDNFVYGREFVSDEHLAAECSRLLERANSRVHGTTKEVPRLCYVRDERRVLLPLAARPYRSILLPETAPLEKAPLQRVVLPYVEVEKRSLHVYTAVVGGM